MKNWLGQDLVPGAVVYRGARQRNTSSYKIGIIESVNANKENARVLWVAGPSSFWLATDNIRDQRRVEGIGYPFWQNEEVRSTLSIESLVVMDNIDIDDIRLERDDFIERQQRNLERTRQQRLTGRA